MQLDYILTATVIDMTEKKANKKEKVVVKKAAKPKSNTSVKKEVLVDDKYPASGIAKNLNVSDFEFLIIKRKANINDSTFLTIKEFRELYKEIIGR